MIHSSPIQKLVELTKVDVDNAARQLGPAQRNLDSARSQLDMLSRYREEYRAQFGLATSSGMPAGALCNFQSFIDTLDVTISQQQAVLANATARVEEATHAWRLHQRRLDSYEVLLARQRKAQALCDARQEQRATDEYVASRYRGHAA